MASIRLHLTGIGKQKSWYKVMHKQIKLNHSEFSTFADYDVISKKYDHGRRPAGADVMADLLQCHSGKRLQDIKLLDVGCGTGNYAAEMAKYGVRNITLFDASEGMLLKARTKFNNIQSKHPISVEYKQGFLPTMPFPDKTFDAAMMNLVIHHLEPLPDGVNFPTVCKSAESIRRILKPGGIFLVTTSTPEQVQGHWYRSLLPAALARFQLRHPTLQILEDMFSKNDLIVKSKQVYLNSDYLFDYDNMEAPLLPEWRGLDSFWSSTTDDEITSAIKLVKQLKADNKLREFFKEHHKCSTVGYFTLFCLSRAKSP